jgi:hypothetical protein
MTFWLRYLQIVGLMLVAGCAAVPHEPGTDAEDDAHAEAPPPAAATLSWSPVAAPTGAQAVAGALPPPWTHTVFPGKKASLYSPLQLDGRDAMAVHAVSSASMLRQLVRVEPADLNRLRFAWKVPALIAGADMAQRDLDDSPVRIVLAFEGDRSRFSAKNALLSELSQAFTGEPRPYATLMYVWCNQREPGSVVVNPRTDRIRKLVMESGPRNLDQWLDYERDIRADFEKAFGEAPGALLAVGIMTDSDNTASTTQAWYGPVRLVARLPTLPALPTLPGATAPVAAAQP